MSLLFRTHFKTITTLCYSYVKDTTLAVELARKTFEQLHEMPNITKILLAKTARNICITATPSSQLPDIPQSVTLKDLPHKTLRSVISLIEKDLSESDRFLFHLKFFGKFTTEAVSEITASDPIAVSLRFANIMKKIGDHLEQSIKNR